MPATIRNRIHLKIATLALLAALALGVSSCATKKDTAFINDPNAKKETALPWNEQQKWEREGEAAALNQQRRY
jgi:predicted ATPase